MRHYPKDEYDFENLKDLNAENWMLEYLKVNPEYVYWGNFEDNMANKKSGWHSSLEYQNIQEGGLFDLDELNECVNFYFQVSRENKICETCDGTGYNSETKQIKDDWYDFANTGRQWCYSITQDEVIALVKKGRLTELTDRWYHCDNENNQWMYLEKKTKDNEWKTLDGEPNFPTAQEVNAWASKTKGIGHDSINHHICVKTRAKRLGVWGDCQVCEGKGRIYLEEKAHLSLQLWILHPRKGCSRGVYIHYIQQEDLPKIFEFLNLAARRNQERFSKIPQ